MKMLCCACGVMSDATLDRSCSNCLKIQHQMDVAAMQSAQLANEQAQNVILSAQLSAWGLNSSDAYIAQMRDKTKNLIAIRPEQSKMYLGIKAPTNTKQDSADVYIVGVKKDLEQFVNKVASMKPDQMCEETLSELVEMAKSIIDFWEAK